jgi:hypothetical protein
MPFAVGIGDVIAMGELVKDIINCLQSVGGAKDGYQELIREFDALETTLCGLDQLDDKTGLSTEIYQTKSAALSCRYPLEQFLTKIQRYEASLGPRSRPGLVRGLIDKLTWTFCLKGEIAQLQSYLHTHISLINVCLARYNTASINRAEQKREEDGYGYRNRYV